jgi:hypothetical protein
VDFPPTFPQAVENIVDNPVEKRSFTQGEVKILVGCSQTSDRNRLLRGIFPQKIRNSA